MSAPSNKHVCEYSLLGVSLCDKLGVLVWRWLDGRIEWYCADHYDFVAAVYRANSDEYKDCRLLCRQNNVEK